jgi:hypothetical protein
MLEIDAEITLSRSATRPPLVSRCRPRCYELPNLAARHATAGDHLAPAPLCGGQALEGICFDLYLGDRLGLSDRLGSRWGEVRLTTLAIFLVPLRHWTRVNRALENRMKLRLNRFAGLRNL